VIAWYRRNGYAFVSITDHNQFSDAQRWASFEDDSFHVISGEEVSMTGAGRQVHVNALCTKHQIGGGEFPSAAAALSWATTEVEAQGGVAIVNHPNFDRALAAGDLLAARRAPLLEIMSGHPYVYSAGIGDRPSAEALWDLALGGGATLMGVAVDDMHHLKKTAGAPASPGRGWVQVFAARNDSSAICAALGQGLLYSSTGVSLRRIRVTDRKYTVWVATPKSEVSFVGGTTSDGVVLLRSAVAENDGPISYVLRGGEEYVRARIRAPDGTLAWTPAVFVTPAHGTTQGHGSR
jgi:hypothetical protein